MPDQEVAFRFQAATLWPFTGYDRNGEAKVSDAPVGLIVRWNDKRTERLQPEGNTVTVDVTAVVDIDVAIGSVMRLGSVDDLPSDANYVDLDGLYSVKTFNATPDIKGRAYYREVGLMRLKDSLPTVG